MTGLGGGENQGKRRSLLLHLGWNHTAPVQSGFGARNDQNTDSQAPPEIPGAPDKFASVYCRGRVVGELSCCCQTQLVPLKRGRSSHLSERTEAPEGHCGRGGWGVEDGVVSERVGARGERAAVAPAE